MTSQFLSVPAWTNITELTRYPATGTFDLQEQAYLGGIIGLNPAEPYGRGVVTFFWTIDPEGHHIVGIQGMNLAASIVSLNQLRLLNQGPYLYMTYEPFSGPNQLAATLFTTHIGSNTMQIAGDTILIDEQNRPIGPNATETLYPCDYYAGFARFYFQAPRDVSLTIYGADLTDQFWPLDKMSSGSMTTIVPLGTWMVVTHNPTQAPITYTLACTPLATN